MEESKRKAMEMKYLEDHDQLIDSLEKISSGHAINPYSNPETKALTPFEELVLDPKNKKLEIISKLSKITSWTERMKQFGANEQEIRRLEKRAVAKLFEIFGDSEELKSQLNTKPNLYEHYITIRQESSEKDASNRE